MTRQHTMKLGFWPEQIKALAIEVKMVSNEAAQELSKPLTVEERHIAEAEKIRQMCK